MTSFTDGNYFSRVFRQTFGISPSSFKASSDTGERDEP
jgi:AraC-like DNA-binding protein